jgi:hypothetical protein
MAARNAGFMPRVSGLAEGKFAMSRKQALPGTGKRWETDEGTWKRARMKAQPRADAKEVWRDGSCSAIAGAYPLSRIVYA